MWLTSPTPLLSQAAADPGKRQVAIKPTPKGCYPSHPAEALDARTAQSRAVPKDNPQAVRRSLPSEPLNLSHAARRIASAMSLEISTGASSSADARLSLDPNE